MPVRVPGQDAGQLEHGTAGIGPQGRYLRVGDNGAEKFPLVAGTLGPGRDRLDDRQPGQLFRRPGTRPAIQGVLARPTGHVISASAWVKDLVRDLAAKPSKRTVIRWGLMLCAAPLRGGSLRRLWGLLRAWPFIRRGLSSPAGGHNSRTEHPSGPACRPAIPAAAAPFPPPGQGPMRTNSPKCGGRPGPPVATLGR